MNKTSACEHLIATVAVQYEQHRGISTGTRYDAKFLNCG